MSHEHDALISRTVATVFGLSSLLEPAVDMVKKILFAVAIAFMTGIASQVGAKLGRRMWPDRNSTPPKGP